MTQQEQHEQDKKNLWIKAVISFSNMMGPADATKRADQIVKEFDERFKPEKPTYEITGGEVSNPGIILKSKTTPFDVNRHKSGIDTEF